MERSNTVDNEVIKLAANGDAAAFDTIYRAYRDKIYYFVVKLGAKPQDAEDIVSETFLEAMKHMQELKNESGLSSWLHTIAKNKFFALGRKESRHQRVDLLADDEEGNVNEGLELAMQHSAELNDDTIMLPEDYAESEETKDILAGMINSLNENQREAIYLFYHRDKSLEQISQLTGASVNTVKSRIHQAKNHLRKMIKELQDKGVVLCAAPVSSLFKACEGKVTVKTGGFIPKALGSLSTKIVAAACAVAIGGTGIALACGLKGDNTMVDRESMNIRPDLPDSMVNNYIKDDDGRTEVIDILDDDSLPEQTVAERKDEALVFADDENADEVLNVNSADYRGNTSGTGTARSSESTYYEPAGGEEGEAFEEAPGLLTFTSSKGSTFTAQAGDVIKYDLYFSSEETVVGLDLGFDIPEGYELVGFVPADDTLQDRLGFVDYSFRHYNTVEEKEKFNFDSDYRFVAYPNFDTVHDFSSIDRSVVGSLLVRLKDNASADNTAIALENIVVSSKDNDVIDDTENYILEILPENKAATADIKAAENAAKKATEDIDDITDEKYDAFENSSDETTTDAEDILDTAAEDDDFPKYLDDNELLEFLDSLGLSELYDELFGQSVAD